MYSISSVVAHSASYCQGKLLPKPVHDFGSDTEA